MRTTRLSVAMLAAVAVTVSACKTDITGLNANPNSPTTAPAGAIFVNAVATTMQRYGAAGYQNSAVSLLAQLTAEVQYTDEDRYLYRPTTIAGYQTGPYTGDLMDYQKVVEQGTAAKDANMVGAAKVMQTFVFQKITDMFGDITYSQALQGGSGPLKPAYDAQKDIYYGMLKTLTDQSAAMGTGAGLGSADPIYGGDAAKWKKFSNSLRLRLAMRLQKADAAKATAELSAALAAGVMTSNADNAFLTWPGDGVFDNPWSANFQTRDDYRVSKTLLTAMNAVNDPRMKVFAQPVPGTTQYVGLQNGLSSTEASKVANATSRIGAIFYPGVTQNGTFGTSAGKKTPSYLMTFAEVSFIKAEAANRGIGGLSASQAAGFYSDGVTASITQWGGSAADAVAYLAQVDVAYKGGSDGLTQILTQKWIAFFGQGEEAWSDWRRTGVPAAIAPGPASTLSYVPRRMLYASTEQSVNAASLADAIARQGADNMQTRIWWDK
jgi:Starch-binding associating with outer membrane